MLRQTGAVSKSDIVVIAHQREFLQGVHETFTGLSRSLRLLRGSAAPALAANIRNSPRLVAALLLMSSCPRYARAAWQAPPAVCAVAPRAYLSKKGAFLLEDSFVGSTRLELVTSRV